MKFDGKEVRGVKVNVIEAPKKNNIVVPIIIVAVLIITIVGIAIFMLSNPDEGDSKKTSDVLGTTSSQASTAASGESKVSGKTVKFKKPSEWGNDINIYVYDDTQNPILENSDWPGEPMVKDGDGVYSYVIKKEFLGGKIMFNDGKGKGKKQYPSGSGLDIVEGKTYEVEG